MRAAIYVPLDVGREDQGQRTMREHRVWMGVDLKNWNTRAGVAVGMGQETPFGCQTEETCDFV